MKDLFLAASKMEIKPFLDNCGLYNKIVEGEIFTLNNIDILISGIGAVATAYYLGQALAKNKYTCIWNFGIAGSFSEQHPLESLVCVGEEIFADLGCETEAGGFDDIFDMRLSDKNARPFYQGRLIADFPKNFLLQDELPRVRSVTVNKVLSSERSIEIIKNKYSPHIVNMEGAAVYYSALLSKTPCVEVRSISDYAGERDKSKWKIDGAIRSLNRIIQQIYEQRAKLS